MNKRISLLFLLYFFCGVVAFLYSGLFSRVRAYNCSASINPNVSIQNNDYVLTIRNIEKGDASFTKIIIKNFLTNYPFELNDSNYNPTTNTINLTIPKNSGAVDVPMTFSQVTSSFKLYWDQPSDIYCEGKFTLINNFKCTNPIKFDPWPLYTSTKNITLTITTNGDEEDNRLFKVIVLTNVDDKKSSVKYVGNNFYKNQFTTQIDFLNRGSYQATLNIPGFHGYLRTIPCLGPFKVCTTGDTDCLKPPSPPFNPYESFKKLCNEESGPCTDCFNGEGQFQGKPGTWTALGCIPTKDLNEFAKWILGKIIFIASGIAFLLMAFGAIQIITSAGNPDKMKAGSQLITSALSGLIFIILSVFLLKLIGVDILRIPGFGS